jgi:hypothetical protein
LGPAVSALFICLSETSVESAELVIVKKLRIATVKRLGKAKITLFLYYKSTYRQLGAVKACWLSVCKIFNTRTID